MQFAHNGSNKGSIPFGLNLLIILEYHPLSFHKKENNNSRKYIKNEFKRHCPSHCVLRDDE